MVFKQLLDSVIEARQLGLLENLPDARLAVDAVEARPVAALAQGDAQVLLVLLDVVGLRAALSAAA